MPWVDEVPSLMQSWYGGNENGNAIADVIFGRVNPSGKMPLTFPKRLEDVPAFGHIRAENAKVRLLSFSYNVSGAEAHCFVCRCGTPRTSTSVTRDTSIGTSSLYSPLGAYISSGACLASFEADAFTFQLLDSACHTPLSRTMR